MFELTWFAAGAATAAVAAILWRRRPPTGVAPSHRAGAPPQRELEQAPTATPGVATAPPEPASRSPVPSSEPAAPLAADARRFALSLAEELATLVSGVEGRAHSLIECAPHRAMLPSAAEALLVAIQRLRTLHNKLVAFAQQGSSRAGATELGELVASLTDELQQMQLGIEVRWDPPPALPRLAASRELVREALLFLCAALLRAERGATRLSIEAELCLADPQPVVQLELALEWVVERSGARIDLGADVGFSIEHDAATHLIRSQGGQVEITHLPGRAARALIRLPAAVATTEGAPLASPGHAPLPPAAGATTTEAVATPPVVRHRYGGALLLEADPAIRAMLANELKATGRAVFVCADGASARSFLAATPERFELLILDHQARLEGDDALGETIRSLSPGLKVCVLGAGKAQSGPNQQEAWPNLHRIHKPFGVHELRQALASVLAG